MTEAAEARIDETQPPIVVEGLVNAFGERTIHEDLDLAIHLHKAGYDIRYDTGIRTNAELRRVQSDRSSLWGYLEWWPRTLRIHGKKTWPVCWFFGVFMLYIAASFLAFVDYMLKTVRR